MNKCSRIPQTTFRSDNADWEWWYYESPGSIEILVDAQIIRTACNEGHGYRFKIPRKMLEASLRRMRSSRRLKP